MGDELDDEIKRTEKEMGALSQTLEHLNRRNTEYRKSFKQVDPHGPEMDELRQLQEQAKIARDTLFRKKKELGRLQTDFEEDSRRIAQIDEQLARLSERKSELAAALSDAEGGLRAMRGEDARAQDVVDRLSAEHRARAGSAGETAFERSLRAQVQGQSVKEALWGLARLAEEYPELAEPLAAECAARGLELPTGGAALGGV